MNSPTLREKLYRLVDLMLELADELQQHKYFFPAATVLNLQAEHYRKLADKCIAK